MKVTSARVSLGAVLIFHGLAHSLPGMRAAHAASGWLEPGPAGGVPLLGVLTVLWAVAMAGFVAAGLGLFGAAAFRRYWRIAAAFAAGSSLLMLAAFRPPLAIPGVFIDFAVLGVLLSDRREKRPARSRAVLEEQTAAAPEAAPAAVEREPGEVLR